MVSIVTLLSACGGGGSDSDTTNSSTNTPSGPAPAPVSVANAVSALTQCPIQETRGRDSQFISCVYGKIFSGTTTDNKVCSVSISANGQNWAVTFDGKTDQMPNSPVVTVYRYTKSTIDGRISTPLIAAAFDNDAQLTFAPLSDARPATKVLFEYFPSTSSTVSMNCNLQ